MMQAAAPVSVMAHASTSGKPKRASKGAWFLRSTPAPKAQRIAWSRSAGVSAAASSMAGITPR